MLRLLIWTAPVSFTQIGSTTSGTRVVRTQNLIKVARENITGLVVPELG